MSPKKGLFDYFNTKYIWTNHWFSGDILVFLGSTVYLAFHQPTLFGKAIPNTSTIWNLWNLSSLWSSTSRAMLHPPLKLTANAPENKKTLEIRRFRAWKPPFFRAFAVSFREVFMASKLFKFRLLWWISKSSQGAAEVREQKIDFGHSLIDNPSYCWWFRNPKQPPGMIWDAQTPRN